MTRCPNCGGELSQGFLWDGADNLVSTSLWSCRKCGREFNENEDAFPIEGQDKK